MVGAGYWVWLIPLSSGSHSVGIVADAKLHPLSTMNSFEKAMAWLEKYQPSVFDALEGKRDRLMDFAFFRNFSYGCKQVFSGPALGPHRRGGPVPRPVLFAGQRLHRHRQHLHLRAGRARPRRPAARGACADLRPDLPLVLREHARPLHRPVPDLRRPRGAAGQGDLGLHLLLGRAVAVLLPAPARRPGRVRRAEASSWRIARRSTRGPGAAARLVGGAAAGDRAQPGGDARPGVAALVRRAQQEPARHASTTPRSASGSAIRRS